MTKISETIIPLYNRLSPICNSKNITLNLDLPDPTIEIEDEKTLKKILEQLIKPALQRIGKNGTLTISIVRTPKNITKLTLKDDGSALTPTEITNLTKQEIAPQATITVHSRLGYGTIITVKIK